MSGGAASLPPRTPREARERAGYGGPEGLARLAKRIRRSQNYLRSVESGCVPCPYCLAETLARHLDCPMGVYLAARAGYLRRRKSRTLHAR